MAGEKRFKLRCIARRDGRMRCDEPLRRDLSKRYLTALSQWMPHWNDQREPFRPGADNPQPERVNWLEYDSQIKRPLRHETCCLGGTDFAQIYRYRRSAVFQLEEESRKGLTGCVLRQAHSQAGDRLDRFVANCGHCGIHQLEDAQSLSVKPGACPGEPGSTCTSLKQLDAQFGFEIADGMAERRLFYAESLGCTSKVQFLSDSYEVAKMTKLHVRTTQ